MAVQQEKTVKVDPESKIVQPFKVKPHDDLKLIIKPREPKRYDIAWSRIVMKSKQNIGGGDETLWHKTSHSPKQDVYDIANAFPGVEFMSVMGSLTPRGDGGSGRMPIFQVTVPEVDIDWDKPGYREDSAERGEDEDTRILSIGPDVIEPFIVRRPIERADGMVPAKGAKRPMPDLELRLFGTNPGLLVYTTQADALAGVNPISFPHLIRRETWTQTSASVVRFFAKQDPTQQTFPSWDQVIKLKRIDRYGGNPTGFEGDFSGVTGDEILFRHLRVDIRENTDDIQVQYFENNMGVFTYTAIPLQIYYRLQPDAGWTPDSVKLHVKNPAGSTIRTINLATTVGHQQTTWDGKDSGGNYVPYGPNYMIEIAATIGTTTWRATKRFTVYEIRQGNCVYRPIRINEHAAILYEYIGGNQLTDILNSRSYMVMEHPGRGNTTGPSNYGNFNNWIGSFCPTGLSRNQRKAILEKAHELDNANIAYVSFPYLDVLTHDQSTTSPSGTDWDGTVADILRIRCDGTVEVAYEDAGVPLYGADTWWNIMSPGAGTGSNLALHNDGADSINPNRQRDGINAAHDLTRNRVDANYLPSLTH